MVCPWIATTSPVKMARFSLSKTSSLLASILIGSFELEPNPANGAPGAALGALVAFALGAGAVWAMAGAPIAIVRASVAQNEVFVIARTLLGARNW